MAINSEWRYGVDGVASDPTHGNYVDVIAASERFWLSNSDSAKENLEVGQWSPATLVMDNPGANLIGTANNDRYVSPTEVDVNELGTVPLDSANVAQAHCTSKLTWEDDALTTTLDNVKFFAFEGDPANAPANSSVVAFERTTTTVRKNQVGGDGDGKAWDSAHGVGGVAAALSMASHAANADHEFFIGFNIRINAYGIHAGTVLRLSFDVS